MMTMLTPHFSREEFELNGQMPAEAVTTYGQLCRLLLEPIRAQFNAPIIVTSGYRSPGDNAAANGVPNSQHMATAEFCAADWYIPKYATNMRPVFDWIRQSKLVWDQVTLEHGHSGDVIHLSWTVNANRREALEGATHNATAYTSWPVTTAAA